MPFKDDEWGYDYFVGRVMSRRNIRFTGQLSNGMPFIGRLTFKGSGGKYTLEGKFNGHLQIIGTGKQTGPDVGMIIIGQHDSNGKLQGQVRKTFRGRSEHEYGGFGEFSNNKFVCRN